ncbi:hypothetical protein BASA84_001163 [Batrachochytrium salamandrivorans]|nr:hypothetical protein BASA62_007444 [Batrachochytrium salamandrivorans]KAH9254696.1 hypothetical protein BASA81_007247 [Batrachochytrium salamandrivorans]KAH9266352.1 hypothetical protein BASA84_001163 [Batrachochytrium salamandrivorans]
MAKPSVANSGLAAATTTVAATTTTTTTTDTVPISTAAMDTVSGDEPVYSEAVNKRLRTLRKRLLKASKYEQSSSSDLNPDQLLAIQRKPEVAFAIKELEDLGRQIALLESQEAAQLKAKAEQDRKAAAAQTLSLEAASKSAFDKQLESFLRCWYALNVALPQVPATSALSATKLEALLTLKSALAGMGIPASEISTYFEFTKSHLHALATHSTDTFLNSSTSYVDLGRLLEDLISPPPPPRFGAGISEGTFSDNAESFSVIDASFNPTSGGSTDKVPQSAEGSAPGDLPPNGTLRSSVLAISFLSPSEVLGQPITQVCPVQPSVSSLDPLHVANTEADSSIPLNRSAASAAEEVNAKRNSPPTSHKTVYLNSVSSTEPSNATNLPAKSRNGRGGRGGAVHDGSGTNTRGNYRGNKPRPASNATTGESTSAAGQPQVAKRRSRNFERAQTVPTSTAVQPQVSK